jgi:biotin carboxyl carrier protein
MNVYVKELLREQGAPRPDPTVYPAQTEFRNYRRVPQSRLIARLGLSDYPTHIDKLVACRPAKVRIPLKHGPGRPAAPLVKAGDAVRRGDVIAEVDFQDVGCMVHASIDGVVTEVGGGEIAIAGGSESGGGKETLLS